MAVNLNEKVLLEVAESLKTESQNINEAINDIDIKIANLKDANQSEVLDELYNKFLLFKTTSLPRYIEVIKSYSNHLVKVSNKYSSLKVAHKANIEAINNDKAFK